MEEKPSKRFNTIVRIGRQIIIDEEDWPRVNLYEWFYNKHRNQIKSVDATRWGKLILSRYILKITDKNIIIDHVNRDVYDNRKCNLRIANKSQNAVNSKPRNGVEFRGVTWYKPGKQWQAQIVVNGKCIYLGRYDDKNEAARIRDAASIKYFGEFAYLNFPDEEN